MQGEFQFLGGIYPDYDPSATVNGKFITNNKTIAKFVVLTKEEAPDTLKILLFDNNKTSFDMVCTDASSRALVVLGFFFCCTSVVHPSPFALDTDQSWNFRGLLQREPVGTCITCADLHCYFHYFSTHCDWVCAGNSFPWA